jgi:hypothetical protein
MKHSLSASFRHVMGPSENQYGTTFLHKNRKEPPVKQGMKIIIKLKSSQWLIFVLRFRHVYSEHCKSRSLKISFIQNKTAIPKHKGNYLVVNQMKKICQNLSNSMQTLKTALQKLILL